MTTEIGLHEHPRLVVARIADQGVRLETACGDGRLVWRRWGAGPPLLLLHGSHGSWLHWIRNIAHLSRTRTVWVPDIPGFGESDLPSFQPSIADVARGLLNGLDALAVDFPLDVIGFSFGGTVAAQLAALMPERIRRIVVVDSGGLGTPMGEVRLRSVSRANDADAAHRHNLLAMMIHDPECLDDLAVYAQSLHVPLARLDVRTMVLPDRLARALELSEVPVNAIWGEHDQPHPNPDLQLAALRRVRPKARMRVISGAGHWSIYENPEGFHAHLGELLGAGD